MQVTNADVFIPTTGIVDSRAIRSAKKLKLIAQPATGYSNIDIETAAELGIPVCTSPGADSLAFVAKPDEAPSLLKLPFRASACYKGGG